MKIKFVSALLFTVLALALSSCTTQNSKLNTQNSLKAGVAEIDITAPIGHRMAGYFDERLATGIHDPLKAKAVVMEQGGQKIALVFCDLVGVSLDITSKARAEASRQTGIPVSNILICATHTHTGPLFNDIRRKYFHESEIAKFGHDTKEKIHYPDFLHERLVKVIVQAHAKMKPSELEVGITKKEGLSFNRRYHMKNGKVAFNPGILNPNVIGPAGPEDPNVSMILVKQNKKLVGGITVFAMHLDCVGGTLYSADTAYYVQQTLRKALGKNYISAYGAGTCGDLNHINVNVKTDAVKGFAIPERIGTALGETVLQEIPKLTAVQQPALAVQSEKIVADLQEPTPKQMEFAQAHISKLGDEKTDFFTKVEAVKYLDLASKGKTWPMEVQVFRLDSETAIVGLPCEIFVELGLAIKAASPFKKTIVISICNDRPSYVPTKKAFIEGSYEVSNARVKSGTGEKLVETAVKLLHEAKK